MTTENTEKLVYTPMEVATALQLSINTIYSLLRENKLPFVRYNRKLLIPRKELDKMLADSVDFNKNK